MERTHASCEALYLVEFQGVEEVNQLADLGSLGNCHEVLLQTVQSHLALVIDINFDRLEKTNRSQIKFNSQEHFFLEAVTNKDRKKVR